ncbi:Unknown protein, partial [Striga hermonthica]
QPPLPPPPPPPHQHALGRDPITQSVLDFRGMHPPAFTGVEGPEAGAEWLQQLESIFDLLFTTYYPYAYCAQMMKDFWVLKQGPRPVDVYEHDFTRMCMFSPMLVNTDEKKAFCFRDGLRPNLRYTLTGHGVLPYSEMVRRASELVVCQNSWRAAAPSYQQTRMIQPISS